MHNCTKRNTNVTSPRHKRTSSLTFLFKSKLHSCILEHLTIQFVETGLLDFA